MLTLRCLKTVALLAILVIVSVFSGTADAQLNPVGGNFHGVRYRLHVQDFDWTQTDTYSKHAIRVENTNRGVGETCWVNWHWAHRVKKIGEGGWWARDDVKGNSTLFPRSGRDLLDKVGWLNVYKRSWGRGRYKIVGFVIATIKVHQGGGRYEQKFEAEDESSVFEFNPVP